MKKTSVNPNLFDSVTSSPDKNAKTTGHRLETTRLAVLLIQKKVENSHLPYHPKKKEETTLAVAFQMFLGTTLKAA